VCNKELYEKCKVFTVNALSLLRNKMKQGETLPFIPQRKIIIKELSDSGAQWSESFDKTLSFILFIDQHEKEIMTLTDYEACEKLLYKDPVISVQLNAMFGTVDESGRIDAKHILFSILHDIVLKTENFDFNEEEFNISYSRVENSLYSDKLKFRLIAPLENFRCDVEEIDLGEGIRIVKLSKPELEELWSITISPQIYNKIFDVRFALEKVYEKDKVAPSTEFSPQFDIKSQRAAVKEEFDSVVTALRIFKAGAVGFNFLQDIPISWIPYGGVSTLGGHGKPLILGPRYHLSGEDVKEFVNFWSNFKEAKTKNFWFLDEVTRRFNFAYEKGNLEDKLIDYIICFESMLLENDDELSYRLSLRVAVLIEENKEKRKEIFSDMRDAYKVRSRIVHGASKEKIRKLVKERFTDLETLISKVEEYLRHSIKTIIDLLRQGLGRKEIIKKLDEKILG